jgi:hypothetical protein
MSTITRTLVLVDICLVLRQKSRVAIVDASLPFLDGRSVLHHRTAAAAADMPFPIMHLGQGEPECMSRAGQSDQGTQQRHDDR